MQIITNRNTRTAWLPVILCIGLGACAQFQPVNHEVQQATLRDLEEERDRLRQQMVSREKEIARLQLRVLDQDSRIEELKTALSNRDQELAESREHLQQANSRIQILAGPAEAAAAIAEAEAAYRVAVDQRQVEPEKESGRNLKQLLVSATAAWESGDYSGAVTLSDRVMRGLNSSDSPLRRKNLPSVYYPEQPLSSPISFRLRVNSHLRSGPGMGFKPIGYLPGGTLVTGLATRGRWVKIHRPQGKQGWIFGKLLSAPE